MTTKTFNTPLTNINNYDPIKSMKFSKKINKKVSKSKSKVEYKIIKISTMNDDGSEGDIIVLTERLFSFGISKKRFDEKDYIYSIPLCMWNKDNPTNDEKNWTMFFLK